MRASTRLRAFWRSVRFIPFFDQANPVIILQWEAFPRPSVDLAQRPAIHVFEAFGYCDRMDRSRQRLRVARPHTLRVPVNVDTAE